MNSCEAFDELEILKSEIGNPDVRGIFRDGMAQFWFDRRLTFAAMQAGVVMTRVIDVGLRGPVFLKVSDSLAAELGYNGGRDGTFNPTL